MPINHWVPFFSLLGASPLHIQWFSTSMRGMIKRRKAAEALAETSARIIGINSTEPKPLESDSNATPATPIIISFISRRPRLASLTARLPHLPQLPHLPPLPLTAASRLSFPPTMTQQRHSLEMKRLKLTRQNSFEREVRQYFTRTSAAIEERLIHFPVVIPTSIVQLVQSLSETINKNELAAIVKGEAKMRNLGIRDQLQAYYQRPVNLMTLDEIRIRAGEGSEELKRFGGRMRRRIRGMRNGGMVDPL
jgi:hypothetical protein